MSNIGVAECFSRRRDRGDNINLSPAGALASEIIMELATVD